MVFKSDRQRKGFFSNTPFIRSEMQPMIRNNPQDKKNQRRKRDRPFFSREQQRFLFTVLGAALAIQILRRSRQS